MSIDINIFKPLRVSAWPVNQQVPASSEEYDLSLISEVGLPPIERERIAFKKASKHAPNTYNVKELRMYATEYFGLQIPSAISKKSLVEMVLNEYDRRFPRNIQSGLIVEDD